MAEGGEDGGSRPCRSLNSEVRTCVSFHNKCQKRSAALYWYSFDGSLVRYAILRSSDYMDMNTYVTHPWCAKDSDTGDRLLIGGGHVYFPEPPLYDDDEVLRMRRVLIELPVYTLKERCQQIVKKMYSKDGACKLTSENVPWTVVNDLKTPSTVPCRLYSGHYDGTDMDADGENELSDDEDSHDENDNINIENEND